MERIKMTDPYRNTNTNEKCNEKEISRFSLFFSGIWLMLKRLFLFVFYTAIFPFTHMLLAPTFVGKRTKNIGDDTYFEYYYDTLERVLPSCSFLYVNPRAGSYDDLSVIITFVFTTCSTILWIANILISLHFLA